LEALSRLDGFCFCFCFFSESIRFDTCLASTRPLIQTRFFCLFVFDTAFGMEVLVAICQEAEALSAPGWR
jgi:hypothetical protein